MVICILSWKLVAQELTSTLHTTFYGVNFAYVGEIVTFTCVTRGSTLIAWSSDEYIGSGGLRLEFISVDQIGTTRSTANGGTVAQLVASTREGGIDTLVSQLNISVQSIYQISSITCHNIGMGTTNTTAFEIAGIASSVFVIVRKILLLIKPWCMHKGYGR